MTQPLDLNPLNDVEVRVLGSLIEKEITTPEHYPLSLNALVNACNQSSNRNPIVHFDESTVLQALDVLIDRKFVEIATRSEARVRKYRHLLYETLAFTRPDIAVMYVLMVRGPQTTGEIRTRAGRAYDFVSLESVQTTLNALMVRLPPLVIRLARQSGQKDERYAHLLSGPVAFAESEPSPRPVAAAADRIGRLQEATIELQQQIDDLRSQFEQLRKQFD